MNEVFYQWRLLHYRLEYLAYRLHFLGDGSDLRLQMFIALLRQRMTFSVYEAEIEKWGDIEEGRLAARRHGGSVRIYRENDRETLLREGVLAVGEYNSELSCFEDCVLDPAQDEFDYPFDYYNDEDSAWSPRMADVYYTLEDLL